MVNNVPQEEIDRVQDEKNVSQTDSEIMLTTFERAIATSEQSHYRLRLYIAGATPRSRRALEKLKLLCETYLQGRYELEVIDVYQSPAQLELDNVVAIPTLVKQLPLPLRQIVGDLSDTEKVLLGLDLVPKE